MREPIPFGKYLLLERIAVGGMAEIWLAVRPEAPRQRLVVKRLLPTLSDDPAFVTLFLDEARIGAQLDHPGIIPIHDLGREAAGYFMAMDYVPGTDLRALLAHLRQRRQFLPVALSCWIGQRVAEALDHAHRGTGHDGAPLRVVHRDLSPANVLLGFDGGVRVIDFGVASAAFRVHREGTALRGKYISKEELASQAIHIEQQVIREDVGSQDQVSAAFGGLNRIEFLRDGSFDVAPMVLPAERLAELQSHLMLCFTGLSRIASEVARSKIENMDKREKELKIMHGLVDQAISVLQSRSASIEEFGSLLHESWNYKRKLSDKVSNSEIDAFYEAARTMGAIGGKLLGAGGGGFFLLFARPGDHKAIREKFSRLVHVPFRFENAGSRVVLYQPTGL